MEGHLARFSDLNACIRTGHLTELVQREEARHIARIRRLAERVAGQAPVIRLVLVAGPSSAGKTTTAIRLCNWIEECGIKTLRLSTDDYFADPASIPLGADGIADWESIDAVDVSRLASDVEALLQARPVRLRKFDFTRHCGHDDVVETAVTKGTIIVLEGIHALNPALTPSVPEVMKFRVYLNLFTRLTEAAGDAFFVDDVRLLRRLVRDCAFRSSTPEDVLRRWPSVERGEGIWINPFRRLADGVFNSALDYEVAVLKPFVMKHLEGVTAEDVLRDAKRLSRLLNAVDEVSSSVVPPESILRETIGDSILVYT